MGKLWLDFRASASMLPAMPNSPHDAGTDLIAALCLEAGRIMEDDSVVCALALPASHGEMTARLERLAQASDDITKLVAAAQVMLRRAAVD